MDKHLPIFYFAIRCIIVTICIAILLGNFMPSYVFFKDRDTVVRANIVSGRVDYKDGCFWR